MCSALGKKVKGQHKLCIWDKKKELFLQAVEVKELYCKTTQQPCPLVTRTALFSCLPPLPDSQGAKGERWQGQEYEVMCKEGSLGWYRMNGKNITKTRRQRNFTHFWNTYQLLKVTDLDRQCQVSLPPTFQSHVVDKTVGVFWHCLCS